MKTRIAIMMELDNDGIRDKDEIKVYHTDPKKSNPNVKQLIDSGITENKYLEIVKPLDNDGIQDDNERKFVELMAKNKELLKIKTLLNYFNEKAYDGEITSEELEYFGQFF